MGDLILLAVLVALIITFPVPVIVIGGSIFLLWFLSFLINGILDLF